MRLHLWLIYFFALSLHVIAAQMTLLRLAFIHISEFKLI